MTEKQKVILILSGGLDSTVLLYHILRAHKEVLAISFDYGQKHKKELECAKNICKELGVSHEIISLDFMSKFESCLTNKDIPVPEGHYEDESMKSTFVPNRNMIMLSIALGYAISHGCKEVYYAAHAGDHAIYPDCRPEFVDAMNLVAEKCYYIPLTIKAPFLYVEKSEVVQHGILLKVPFENTWSCYKGGEMPCGKCGTCVERLEAFKLNGIKDPLIYEEDVNKK